MLLAAVYFPAGASAADSGSQQIAQVQAMIDTLPASMTEDSMEELLAYKDELDAAIGALSADEIAQLDLSKYNAVYNAPMTAASTWDYYTNPDSNGGYYAVITGYNGSGGSVTIPNTLGGAKVRGIAGDSFYYSDAAITSLTCGSNLQWFSDFRGLEDSLRSVNFSAATIEDIPSAAFFGCEKLTSFSWPKGVKTVGTAAFACTGLTSVTIPSTVTSLNGGYSYSTGAFEDCSQLTSVTINATGLTRIPAYTFRGCTALTTVNWGSSKVTSIGNQAFLGCTALTSLTLPTTLTSLGDECFADSGITTLNLPDNLYSFSGTSFQFATKLASLTVNDTNPYYKSEDGILFNKAGTKLVCYPAGKAYVSTYRIPYGVTTIGRGAFGGSFTTQNIYCVIGRIANLYFPDTVKQVEQGGAAFYSGNFYFCGDKPATTDYCDLGYPTKVNYYYTPGRTGWTTGNTVRVWADSAHCTVKNSTDVDPTCTVAGGKEISCPVCGYTASDRSGAAALE